MTSLQVSPNFELHFPAAFFECSAYTYLPNGGTQASTFELHSPVTADSLPKVTHPPVFDTVFHEHPSPSSEKEPNLEGSLTFWANQEPSVYGVLNGYEELSEPDLAASRRFLRSLMPRLELNSRQPSPRTYSRRKRALETCAGIGRVTSNLLLDFVHDVVLVEPVEALIQEGWNSAAAAAEPDPYSYWGESDEDTWPGLYDGSKSVTFVQGPTQLLDPSEPLTDNIWIDRIGFGAGSPFEDMDTGFDIIWVQWCSCYLQDHELLDFLERSRKALRKRNSYIILKENNYPDTEDGKPQWSFSEADFCLSRSDAVFKQLFRKARLRLVKEKLDPAFHPPLMKVKFYALQPM